MPLAPGTRLGPHEILAPLGAGGMGEVYRARDTNRGRDVAIKVLPAAFAEDPGRMARFEREAKVLASLNHPNIAHIYGVEENALVMELVEGQSPQGPLPFDDAWKIATQIADALDYAHERGVVHRDLKPANVKVAPDGVVKLLDFGLAKALTPDAGETPSESRAMDSPTLTMGATVAGVILGTAAYMAPEQAKGKKVDKRADIWSWGVVLYELLTGDQMFQGDDAAEILAAVIHKQPDLARVPAKARPLLRRCLEKDPKQRLRDIGEARFLIESQPDVPSPAKARPARLAWSVAAGCAAAAALLGCVAWREVQPSDRPLVRLDVDLGPDVALLTGTGVGGGSSVILSPDGSRLVYVASVAGGPRKLFTRRLDQAKTTELAGTEGAIGPTFSPNGQSIGFLMSGKLNKISVDGGAVVPLGNVVGAGGGTNVHWTENGFLYSRPLAGMVRIPSGGGPPTPLSELANGEFFHGLPQLLPGGKAVIFAAYPVPDSQRPSLDVLTLADRHRKTVVPRGASPRYVATGHLLYTNRATLFAVPFDPNRLETRGVAVPMLDDVAANGGLGEAAQLDISNTGTLVYIKSSRRMEPRAVTYQWLDSSGKGDRLVLKPEVRSGGRLSPDGRRTAFSVKEGGDQDIEVYDIDRETWTRVTFGGGLYTVPVWTPDGQYLIFDSQTRGGLYWARADGAGQPQPLTQTKARQTPLSVSPDGKFVVFREPDAEQTGNQLWTLPVSSASGGLRAGKPALFFPSRFNNSDAAFSPDGRWLAYVSNESGMPEVYVRPFPAQSGESGGKVVVSNRGGSHPLWSRTSPDLLFQSGDEEMAVRYTVKGAVFQPDKPQVWASKVGGTVADLSIDGKRLLVSVRETEASGKPEHDVVFLQNFFDELRRRAPLN